MSGEPGSGKTALLAQLALVSAPAASVVRFVGATPRSRALRTFLHDVTCSLRERRAEAVPDRPASAADAVAVFRDELDRARPADDGLVVLDGVDQLDAAVGDVHDVDLSWLPTRLPAGVQLVVSARVGPVRDALERHLEAPAVVVPPMPVSDGARLLDAWLGALRHPRRLQPRQREEVLRSFRARGLPLQLRLATEEARHWASWTEVGEGALADDVPGLIAQLFERLESEHGPMLVRAALGGIAAARHGLSEEELLDLLSLDTDVPAEVRQRYPVSPHLDGRVPPVLWVRLSSDLEPYLDERSADGAVLLGFFHAELAEAARRRYLTGEAQRSRSALLADYFAAQPVVLGDGRRPNLRMLSELPYQLTRAQRWDQLHDVLTDVRFLEAKVRWGGADAGAATGSAARRSSSGVHELEADLAFALANWPSEP